MSILNGYLPHGVFVCGGYYPVRTDFRLWLDFENRFSDRSLNPEERINSIIKRYFIRIPDEKRSAISALVGFYTAGRTVKGEKTASAKVFDFAADFDLIYAAFLSEYSLRLSDGMHWWEFLALFAGLSDNCRLAEVMKIRAVNPADISNPAERRRYRRLKRLYRLDGEECDAGSVLADAFGRTGEMNV